ncbi:YaiI/YqxD family protein [Virgibacillus halophilus]|uniref:YaiI/YqxD family protein n=1 Tax=Tigheibacillus halophilus TaxID=361280 RepID=UPI00362E5757
MKIYVDADACPVKDTIVSVARSYNIPVTLVMSFSHFSNKQVEGAETVYVDPGSDAADYRIIQLAKKGDMIITQDYGLASLALGKDCIILHHKGFQYTNKNIEQLLQTRHLSAKARKAGQRTKGPKAFTNDDRKKFEELLRNVLRERIEE